MKGLLSCRRTAGRRLPSGARRAHEPVWIARDARIHAFREIQTLQDAVRVVSAANSPNIGITQDALHFFRSGGTVADLEAVDPTLFGCVQLCDGTKEAPADHVQESRYGRLYPGDGNLPLRSLLAATPEELPVTVEAPSVAHAHLTPSARAREAVLRT